MDNATHHHQQIVQLNTTNSQNVNHKSPGEMDNFLTIRLLMQGKVNIEFRIIIILFFLICTQEVGSIIGKRGDNIKSIREEVNEF